MLNRYRDPEQLTLQTIEYHSNYFKIAMVQFILHLWIICCCIGFINGFPTPSTRAYKAISSTRLFGIQIPVFPLRRTVRLPTESLTLNLYEERYLELAEYVLQQEYPYFGAIYSANKPQVVRNGTGPIVPLLERGNLGVLFLVQDSEEGMIPTRGGIPRRRIRLVARGAVRFQIQEILQNGYDTSFIMADTELYLDQYNESANAVVGSQEILEWARTTQAVLKIDSVNEHSLASELASFHTSSQTLLDGRSRERLAAIQCQDTQERSKQPIQKSFPWW